MSASPSPSGLRVRPLRDLALAVTTLTALPLRVGWPKGERTDAPGYYGFVGLGIGATGYGAVRLLELAGWTRGAPLVVAALVVALWSVITRMLHWDGLGDVADGFWAHDPARRLEIMSDSAVGAFAVTAISLGVVVEVASIGALLTEDRLIGVVVVPALARMAATFGAWFGAPAKSDGLGASVVGRPRVGAIIPTALVLTAVATLCVMTWGVAGAVFLAGAVVLALGVPHVIASRFGGVTGDVLGASVVIVEALLLAALAVWW